MTIRLEFFLASLDSIETKQEYDMQRWELTPDIVLFDSYLGTNSAIPLKS